MVAKLIHISDIHIPKDAQRLEMFRTAFQNFFRTIDQFVSRDCMIVICGDLLHSKENISPEQIMLARQFLEQCGKRCQTILIAGNHDMNMSSSTQLDSLTPCTSNIPNVVYLTESGVRIFDNIAFVVNSILLNVYNFELDTVDVLKQQEFISHSHVKDLLQGFTSVCLYHGIVEGATCDNGYRLSSKITLDHLQGFDHVLLGDVHKHQYLDTHIAYSGSFVQQNHGEEIEGHGFILWDLESKTSGFHAVENPFCFYTIYLERPIDDPISRLVGKSFIHLRMIAPTCDASSS
jgi:DNA repair exonuclease SbcCD nuclease subunit